MTEQPDLPCAVGDLIEVSVNEGKKTGEVKALIGGFAIDVLVIIVDWEDGSEGQVYWPMQSFEILSKK